MNKRQNKIVHMDKRVEKFLRDLSITNERKFIQLDYYDYDEGKEIYRYDREETILLPDFEIFFNLVITQTGVFTPATGCEPPEFTVETTEVEINNLEVFDRDKEGTLRFDRETFTQVVQEVKDLIIW